MRFGGALSRRVRAVVEWLGSGLAQDLFGDGDAARLAEEEEAQEVGEGVALGPLEVDVRVQPVRSRTYRSRAARALGWRRTPRVRGAAVAAVEHLAAYGQAASNSEGSRTVTSTQDEVLLGREVVVGADLLDLLVTLVLSRLSGSLAMNRIRAGWLMSRTNRSAMSSRLTRVTRSSKARASREKQRDEDDAGDEAGADLDAVGAFDDVHDGRVEEDRGDDGEGDGPVALAGLARGDGHGDRGGADEDEDTGGVGAALRVDVGIEIEVTRITPPG